MYINIYFKDCFWSLVILYTLSIVLMVDLSWHNKGSAHLTKTLETKVINCYQAIASSHL